MKVFYTMETEQKTYMTAQGRSTFSRAAKNKTKAVSVMGTLCVCCNYYDGLMTQISGFVSPLAARAA